MSWRTVIVNGQSKLDYKMGYLVVRGIETKRILINEIKSINNLLENNKPPKGLVQSLSVTEKQFSKMKYISGEWKSDVIDSEDRVIIL